MRTISLKLSDTDYETLSKAKGDKTISDYIRALIAGKGEGVRKETETLRTILSEVALIRNEPPRQRQRGPARRSGEVRGGDRQARESPGL